MEYWALYDTVKEVYASRNIYDEDIIHAKVKEIINRNEASHDATTSTGTRQANGD